MKTKSKLLSLLAIFSLFSIASCTKQANNSSISSTGNSSTITSPSTPDQPEEPETPIADKDLFTYSITGQPATEYKVTALKQDVTNLVIPDVIDSLPVVSFDVTNEKTILTSIKKVYIGANVKNISLAYMPNLETIEVSPNNKYFQVKNNCLLSATNLGDGYFLYAACKNSTIPTEFDINIAANSFIYTSITSLNIPANVVKIDERAFAFNKLLTDISSDNPKYRFKNNCLLDSTDSKNEKVLFANDKAQVPQDSTVKSLGDFAFRGSVLDFLYIPNNITSLGDYCFSYSNMTEVKFATDSPITTLKYSFIGSNIETFTVPSAVVNLVLNNHQESSFTDCLNLKYFYFHKNVNSVPTTNMFRTCSNLQEIVVESGSTYFSAENGIFYRNSPVKYVEQLSYGDTVVWRDDINANNYNPSYLYGRKIKKLIIPATMNSRSYLYIKNCEIGEVICYSSKIKSIYIDNATIGTFTIPSGVSEFSKGSTSDTDNYIRNSNIGTLYIPESFKLVHALTAFQGTTFGKIEFLGANNSNLQVIDNQLYCTSTSQSGLNSSIAGKELISVFNDSINPTTFDSQAVCVWVGAFNNRNFKTIDLTNSNFKEIRNDVFVNCPVEELRLPATLSSINQNSNHVANNMSKIKKFVVHPDNKSFRTEDGVLIYKSGNAIARGTVDYIVPESAYNIYPMAFSCFDFKDKDLEVTISTSNSTSIFNFSRMKSITFAESITSFKSMMYISSPYSDDDESKNALQEITFKNPNVVFPASPASLITDAFCTNFHRINFNGTKSQFVTAFIDLVNFRKIFAITDGDKILVRLMDDSGNYLEPKMAKDLFA